ncbi:MAG: 30S ribosome-binding factor RbfA [Bacilli bacterium]|nr:30S ribosome-binding factor RbfA [Bacilli bacterium]
MANKSERIPIIIQKNITEILMYKVKNPHLGFLTVTGCDVSGDFSYAKVFVSFIGKNGYSYEKRIEELNNAKGYIRSELAKSLDIHKVPELTFILDDSFDRGAQIEESLKREENELEEMKNKEKF